MKNTTGHYNITMPYKELLNELVDNQANVEHSTYCSVQVMIC